MRHSINGICNVLFTLKNGSKKLVRMNADNFAHLVSEFTKKKRSVSVKNMNSVLRVKHSSITASVYVAETHRVFSCNSV